MCVQYRSDIDLTGKLIEFTPALYASSTSQIPSNPNTEWQLIYPSGGPIDMDFVGQPENENMTATIEALDNFNFVICYEWFVLPNIVGYLGDQSFNNLDFFNGSGENGYVNFFVNCAGGDTSVASNPIQVDGMCPDNFNWDLGPLEGYKPGDDLTVTINAPDCQNIANNFYVGFMENTAANNFPFHTDYNLNYGLANNGVSQVQTIGNSTAPPVTCFSGAQGFQSTPTNGSTATVTIAGNCLTSGTYWLYVVYKKNGVWQTCVSPPIEQTACARDPIMGTMFRCVTHNGTPYNNTNVTGLSNLGTTEICVKLDRASFEASMAAAGITGTMDQYFAGVNIYAGAAVPTAQNIGSSGGTPVSYTLGATELMACTTYQPGSADCQRYYTFQFIFDYLDAGRDIINVPIEASYSCNVLRTTVPIKLNGEMITESFCCQVEGELEFDINLPGDCEFFIGQGYGAWSPIGSSPSVSTELIPCGGVSCIRAICSNPTSGETPCECPEEAQSCPILPIKTRVVKTGQNIDVFIDYSGFNDEIDQSQTTIFDSINGGPVAWNFQSYQATCPSTGSCAITITKNIFLKSGCHYFYTKTFFWTGFQPDQQIDETVLSPQNATIPGDCPDECPEDNPCNNSAYVDWDCDPDTGVITSHSIVENINSGLSTTQQPEEDIVEETNDDGEIIKVTIDKTWYFNDGCPPISITEILECEPFTPCVNTREIEIEVDDDCNLKMTITDTFDSNVYYDQLELIINRADGTTESFVYDQLTGPYADDLEICYGDTIRWDFITAFDDGCLQLPTRDSYTHEPEQEASKDLVLEDDGTGLLKATITPDYPPNFNPETETLFIETKKLDGTSTITEYDQINDPYQDDIEIDPECEYCAWCVVVPDKCCLPTLETDPVCFKDDPEPEDCDYSSYGLGCSYDQELCKFIVTYTGDPMANTSSPMFPVFTLGNGINPLDQNNSGTPIPESGFEIDGEGLLIIGWRIKLPGCDEITIHVTCTGKPIKPGEDCDNPIYIQNCDEPDPNEPGLVEIKECIDKTNTLLQQLLDCCEESDNCDCEMNPQCTGFSNPDGSFNFAQIVINLSGPTCDTATVQMFDPSGVLVLQQSPNVYNLTEEGDYTIILTDGDCSDSEIYKLCIPNAGNLAVDPPTFDPVPNI